MHSSGLQLSAELGTRCTCPRCRVSALFDCFHVVTACWSLRAGWYVKTFCWPLPFHLCDQCSRSVCQNHMGLSTPYGMLPWHCDHARILLSMCVCVSSGACQPCILSKTHMCCMLEYSLGANMFALLGALYIWSHFFNCACALFYASRNPGFVACMQHSHDDASPCICCPDWMLLCGTDAAAAAPAFKASQPQNQHS